MDNEKAKIKAREVVNKFDKFGTSELPQEDKRYLQDLICNTLMDVEKKDVTPCTPENCRHGY